eukprot:CAMPEP_0196686452 /NCGR_PEP_ID=MMETSP1090-20130531/12592_1 /TAXON_ID=37098 /ORGANISM="Isochrysis sp, Strain CCMP1244" /LENGTH=425 /DNA_ID=CAMNT_0042025073 /DNA_START=27 /DNA_END=1300 /DNA_ORIENTATION=+
MDEDPPPESKPKKKKKKSDKKGEAEPPDATNDITSGAAGVELDAEAASAKRESSIHSIAAALASPPKRQSSQHWQKAKVGAVSVLALMEDRGIRAQELEGGKVQLSRMDVDRLVSDGVLPAEKASDIIFRPLESRALASTIHILHSGRNFSLLGEQVELLRRSAVEMHDPRGRLPFESIRFSRSEIRELAAALASPTPAPPRTAGPADRQPHPPQPLQPLHAGVASDSLMVGDEGRAGGNELAAAREEALDEVRRLKPKEVKIKLAARGLPTTGKQKDLLARLQAAVAAEVEELHTATTEGVTEVEPLAPADHRALDAGASVGQLKAASESPRGRRFTVTLTKQTADAKIGLALEGDAGPPQIRAVREGGLAIASGQLREGLSLLTVNDVRADGHSHAAKLLKEAGVGQLVLGLVEPHAAGEEAG